MHLLLTRPEADNEPLAGRLRAAGHRVSGAPMLEIDALGGGPIDDRPAAGILLGSANAVRHGAARLARRELPVWCVGEATAAAAAAAGFRDLRVGGGDGATLARFVIEQARPDDGPLLYPCGVERRPEPERGLLQAGFRVEAVPVYEAREADGLPEAVADALARGDIDAVLLYSPRSARRFADLAARMLRPGLVLAALSPAVAGALGDVHGRVVTAPRPDEAALLGALAAAFGPDFAGA